MPDIIDEFLGNTIPRELERQISDEDCDYEVRQVWIPRVFDDKTYHHQDAEETYGKGHFSRHWHHSKTYLKERGAILHAHTDRNAFLQSGTYLSVQVLVLVGARTQELDYSLNCAFAHPI
jgi:hypothetical protein